MRVIYNGVWNSLDDDDYEDGYYEGVEKGREEGWLEGEAAALNEARAMIEGSDNEWARLIVEAFYPHGSIERIVFTPEFARKVLATRAAILKTVIELKKEGL